MLKNSFTPQKLINNMPFKKNDIHQPTTENQNLEKMFSKSMIIHPSSIRSSFSENLKSPVEVSTEIFPKSLLSNPNSKKVTHPLTDKKNATSQATWKQYLPFTAESIEATSLNSNQQSASLSTGLTSAKYDVTKSNIEQSKKSDIPISGCK